MIVRNLTLTAGSNSVTCPRTSDLTSGLFLYGTGMGVEYKVDSIVNSTSFLMNKNATASGKYAIEITSANVGTYHERTCILKDVKDTIDERGANIYIDIRTEYDVERDRYLDMARRGQTSAKRFHLKAYPIDYRPSIYRLEKAGLREENDATIWTAMQDWIDAGVDFDDIITGGEHESINVPRFTVKIDGQTFEIKEKSLVGQVNDTFMYITLGISKK